MNICLTANGLDSLNDISGSEATRALSLLNRTRKALLLKGYKFNIDKIDLNRDTGGEIILPDTYLQIELPSPFVVRDRKIYNPDIRSFLPGKDFTDAKVALDLDFEKLPEVAADWIAWDSARHFVASTRTAATSQYAYVAEEASNREVTLGSKYPAKIKSGYSFGAHSSGHGTCGPRWCNCCA